MIEFEEIEKLLTPNTTTTIEYRLYYDSKGCIISYTCEKLAGNYIVIDKQTFAEARHDIKIVDGQLVKVSDFTTISKLHSDSVGVKCAIEDVNIIVPDDYIDKTITWNVKIHEFRNN
jgi:hypothetical protein